MFGAGPSGITRSFDDEKTNILIVDDNTFNVYSLKLLIEEHFKMLTDTAYSGEQAINKFKERLHSPYKLILTDINMP